MPRTQNTSIARKLTWMNMLVSAAALLLACAAFIGYDMVTFRSTIVRNLSTQAQIIGSNSASALLFDDPQAAETTLSALRAAPDILSAVIYMPGGQALAEYSRDKNSPIPSPPLLTQGQLEMHQLKNNQIVLVRAIVFQGKPTGTVYIRSDMEELNHRLLRYPGIAAVVLLVSLLAALLVSSIFRRSVAEPIVHLAEVAAAISHDKNYSIRATPLPQHGELSVLIDAFNGMLAQIDRNEQDLRKAHDQLEQRVRERTAELQAAKDELEAFSQSLLRAKEELERAAKFKDQFLSTMSHELRTPLNAVLGFSDLLTEERYGPLNERQQRYVKHIHTGGKHLLTLINDILDLSKIEAGRLQLTIESVPLVTSFAEVADTMRPLADKKSHTLVQRALPGLSVRADATRLKQILMNLVGNAIKFTPEGGKIELAANRVGNFVRVEVRDSGPGIPPEEQQRIFDAFYRLRRSEKAAEGTGLGLAITQRLVQLHGGELGVESEVGAGSCFHFTLPVVPTFAAEWPDASESRAGRSLAGSRILVVEDDSSAAHLLETQLTSAGCVVTVCRQPERALEIAAELQPSAITIDIVMKPINGWELLSNLKCDSRTAPIPVIVVTIVDQPSTGALLGADEYVVKPVDKATLLSAVKRCLSRPGTAPKRSILVIEDDDATREFIAELLSKNDFAVRTAADGHLARKQIDAAMPDLVILDLILPDVSGFQLLAEWRRDSRTANLPVFVLTSKDLTPHEREYLRSNAEALFQKQETWQDALLTCLERVVLSGSAVPS
ncbi:MAG TPA: response regulator [Candidatus Acidoferrales bacterium]|jgi:signal transduction histidine kinase/DNA-binding response OmpR family regulator|nr:response regulator [Candidatus Acidoferrales bacterium]